MGVYDGGKGPSCKAKAFVFVVVSFVTSKTRKA